MFTNLKKFIKMPCIKVYEGDNKEYYRLKALKTFTINAEDLKINLRNYSEQFEENKNSINLDDYSIFNKYNYITIYKGDVSGLIYRDTKFEGIVWIDKGITVKAHSEFTNSLILNTSGHEYIIENANIIRSVIANTSIKDSIIVNTECDILNYSKKPFVISRSDINDITLYNTITNSKEINDQFENYDSNIYNGTIHNSMIFMYDGYIHDSIIDNCTVEYRQIYINNSHLKDCNIYNSIRKIVTKYFTIHATMYYCNVSGDSYVDGNYTLKNVNIEDSYIKGMGNIEGKDYDNMITLQNCEINLLTDNCNIISDKQLTISYTVIIGGHIRIIVKNKSSNNELFSPSLIKNSNISSIFSEETEILIKGNTIYMDESCIDAINHSVNIKANDIYLRNASLYIFFIKNRINSLSIIGSTINHMRLFSSILYNLGINVKIEYCSITHLSMVIINTNKVNKDIILTDNTIRDVKYFHMNIDKSEFNLALEKQCNLRNSIIVYNNNYKKLDELF